MSASIPEIVTTSAFAQVIARRSLLNEQIEQLLNIAHADLGKRTPDLEEAECMLAALEEDLSEIAQIKVKLGFHQEVLDQMPQWQVKVDHIREDQKLLLTDLKRFRESLTDRGHLRRLQRYLRGWLARFHDIEHREHRLIQDAANVDVGGEG